MSTDDNGERIEYSDAGYPIEIYTDERIEEFLAEDKLTPEQKKQIEEKLRQPRPPKQ
jgi:hypothetical protein